MSDDKKEQLNDDLWKEFASAFGSQTPPSPLTFEPGEQTPAQEIEQRANQSEEIATEKLAELDADEVLRTLEAMRPAIPQLPALIAAVQPKHESSLVSAPPVTVHLKSRDELDDRVYLETRLLGPAKVGEKSLAVLRLRFPSQIGRCDVTVTSDLLDEPEVFRVPINSELFTEAGPIRILPKVAGVEQLNFELRFFNSEGVPVEYLRGTSTLKIRPSDTKGMLNAGGDIIVVGKSIPDLHADPFSDQEDQQLLWSGVNLEQDPDFPGYLRKIRPEPDGHRPKVAGQGASTEQSTESGVIYTRLNGHVCCWAVVSGMTASVGRGGAGDTSWWIRPTSGDPKQFTRISRRHLTFELRAKHAWVIDHSANGTLLNGKRLAPEQRTILSDGDKLDLSGAITLSVRLFSDAARVTQIQFDRSDALSGKFLLSLSLPGTVCQLPLPGRKIWCVWVENGSVSLNDGSDRWKNANSGETVRTTNQTDIAWHRLPGSVDQDQLFPGNR